MNYYRDDESPLLTVVLSGSFPHSNASVYLGLVTYVAGVTVATQRRMISINFSGNSVQQRLAVCPLVQIYVEGLCVLRKEVSSTR